jgi:hypothetical protein
MVKSNNPIPSGENKRSILMDGIGESLLLHPLTIEHNPSSSSTPPLLLLLFLCCFHLTQTPCSKDTKNAFFLLDFTRPLYGGNDKDAQTLDPTGHGNR